jgi:hypothetical protein
LAADEFDFFEEALLTDLVGSTSDITLNEEDIIAVGDDTSITIITQKDFYEEIEREI